MREVNLIICKVPIVDGWFHPEFDVGSLENRVRADFNDEDVSVVGDFFVRDSANSPKNLLPAIVGYDGDRLISDVIRQRLNYSGIDVAYATKITTAKQNRGLGIGRKTITAAFRTSQSDGMPLVWRTSIPNAREAYDRIVQAMGGEILQQGEFTVYALGMDQFRRERHEDPNKFFHEVLAKYIASLPRTTFPKTEPAPAFASIAPATYALRGAAAY